MDNPLFWSVVKANFIVAAFSILFSIVVTVLIAVWRRRRLKNMKPLKRVDAGPRAVLFGGAEPQPGHCPLCGRDWPLPGPLVKPSEEQK